MNFSSSWHACPDTCTCELPPWITSAPARWSESMTRETFDSLPGIACADRTTTSSSLTFRCLCSCAAMSDNALIGSPCDPVQITQISSGREARDLFDVDDLVRGEVEESHLAAERDVVHHRTAEERDMASRRDRLACHLEHAMQVRRERRDDEAPIRVITEQVAKDRADGRLRTGEARLLGVRGIREEELHALAADLAQTRQVGGAPVDRREVDLEVARVQDRAGRRVIRHGEAVRHGMRDGHELALHRADRAHLAVGDRDQLGLGRASRLPRCACARSRATTTSRRSARERPGAGTTARRCGPRARA